MGGSNKTSRIDPAMQNITPATPPWLAGAKPLVLPQAAPGQLAALASQLAQGGYGTTKANLAWMDQVYDPVYAMKLGAPPKIPTRMPVVAPNGMVPIDGKWKPAPQTGALRRPAAGRGWR
jgi:hypothetical protein